MGYAQSKVKYLFYGDDISVENSTIPIISNVESILEKNRNDKSLNRFGNFIDLDLREGEEKCKYLEYIKEDLERNINMKEFDYRYRPIYNKLSNLGKTAYEIYRTDLVIERNNKIIDNVLTLKNNGINKNENNDNNDSDEFHDIMKISIEEI